MLHAKNFQDIRVVANDAIRDGIYYCPYCKERVTLKRGRNIAAHFAHRKDSQCPYRSNESLLHHETKHAVYNQLLKDPFFQEVELEKRFSNTRADIFAKFNDKPVAIEIQVSSMSEDDIDERFRRWTAEGVHVLFIVVGINSKYKYSELRKRALYTYLQRLYFGKLYFWDDDNLHVTHLKSISRGLYRQHPPEGKSILSFRDLRPTKRAAFKELPECLIVTDNIKAWWTVKGEAYNRYVCNSYGFAYDPEPENNNQSQEL